MLELLTLGRLEIRPTTADEYRPIEILTQTKRVALLAYLAIEGRAGLVRRDRVLAFFWPELDQKHASAALRQTLYVLRGALGANVLVTRGEELGVDPEHICCDAAAFEQALADGRTEVALDLYRGDFLEGFHAADVAPEFEHWLSQERERLRQLAVGGATELSQRALAAGDSRAAARWARRALEIDPVCEAALRRLLTALDAAGDRAGAVMAYDAFARHLDEEIGVEPSAESQALLQAIRERSETNTIPTLSRAALPSGQDPNAETAHPRKSRWTSVPAFAALALALLLLIVTSWALWPFGTRESTPEEHVGIAVLPFANLGGEAENKYFSDGLSEDILTAIARIEGLRVISRTSTMQYRNTTKSADAIADELGVRMILEGSVRREGDRVRVTAQLIDGRIDQHLWAETYDGEIEDIFAIQTDIAQRIAATLRPSLSSESLVPVTMGSTDLTSYDLYLQARERALGLTSDDNDAAIALFSQALERDSTYARAYAGMAFAFVNKQVLTGNGVWTDRAMRASRKAIALDPALADGYVALGQTHLYRDDFEAARNAFLEAIERNPSHARALSGLAAADYWAGRFDEALRWALQGAAVDPKIPQHRQQVGLALLEVGEVDQAEAWLRQALKLQPDLAYSLTLLARVALERGQSEAAATHARHAASIAGNHPWILALAGDAALIGGDLETAARYYESAVSAAPDADTAPYLELSYIRNARGDRGAAAALQSRAARQLARARQEAKQSWLPTYQSARLSAQRGEAERALDALDEAYRGGWRGHLWGDHDPLLLTVADDERYRLLLASVREDKQRMRRRAEEFGL